jgi:Flp pilus assembly protein TadG
VSNPKSGRFRRRSDRSRGQAVVEFALVIPLFIMLLAGMIDFGIGLYDYMVIIGAARDGARAGSVTCGTVTTPSCSTATTSRVNTASGGLSPTITVVCATAAVPGTSTQAICNSGGAKEGGSITVTASYSYRMIWPLAFGTVIPMTSTAKFMVQ